MLSPRGAPALGTYSAAWTPPLHSLSPSLPSSHPSSNSSSSSSLSTSPPQPFRQSHNSSDPAEPSSSSAGTIAAAPVSLHFLIPPSSVTIDTTDAGLLGAGTYGIVRRARYDRHPVAVKTLFLRGGRALTKRVEKEFQREAAVLAQLNHPRVVRFFGVVVDPTWGSAIVMEYVPGGSLFEIAPPFVDRLLLAYDVACGMLYLHSHRPRPIFHRDLKSMNVLCDVEHRPGARRVVRAKLADFGLAVAAVDTLDDALGPKGTPLWMAPELNDPHARFTPACDVFSFGVLLTEI
ncbi:kinase-like domain-containing protein, partial [Zopfochytrium polystomum]